MMSHALKAFCWNSHSVLSKISELSHFVDINKIDVIFLSETWLNETSTFYLPNFDCYRADRHRGGVAILIRKAIPHSFLKTISHELAEAVSIIIHDTVPFTLTSIYCSPNANKQQASEFFDKVLSIGGPSIVAGDFNAKHTSWNNVSNNRRGIDLERSFSRLYFDIHSPDSSTNYPPTGSPSVIDFVVSKQIFGISDPEVLNELSSDHLPVSFSIPYLNSVPKDEKILNFRKANWKNFRAMLNVKSHELTLQITDLSTPAKIEELVSKINYSVDEATRKSVPLKSRFKARHPYSGQLSLLIRERNRFRNLYKRTLDRSYKSIVSQLNQLIRKEANKIRAEEFNEKLSNLIVRDNSLWQFTKALKNKKRVIPPLKNANNVLAFTSQAKAHTLAKSFSDAHNLTIKEKTKNDRLVKNVVTQLRRDIAFKRTKDVPSIGENARRITRRVSVRIAEEAPVGNAQDLGNDVRPDASRGHPYEFKFTDSEVWSIVRHLNIKKASGPDNISNQVLRNLPNSTVRLLTSVFNACLDISYFPSSWKEAKIVPIHKPKADNSSPKSYRPISLLSNIGKIFERLILSRLQEHEKANKIFIPQQFGFRSEHSTVQQILRITEEAQIGFNLRQSTGLVTLDLEKAFDSVWHDGLLYKLSKIRTPLPLLGLIESYLEGRKSYVEIDGKKSATFNIPAGVPQGSILSPHLFNVFINDIPLPSKCQLAIYADDTAIFCRLPWKNAKGIRKTLCDTLKGIANYFSSWRIKLNATKTKFIVFSQSRNMFKKLDLSPPMFNGEIFEWNESVTYLGVELDRKLSFLKHIEKVVGSAKGMTRALYCLLKRNNSVPVQSKISVYRSIIRPIMTYACVAFNNCPVTHFKKIQVQQNKCLRLALNADLFDTNIDIHKQAGIPFIREYVDKLTKQFYERANNHDNNLINELGRYTLDDVGGRVKHRLPLKI
jgi:endonuclease/exonuclease/phosphatase family metal-dependent hydrolase